ncbi:MAG: lysophospholipid acyltransferase family protein [Anaerolineales bacterium]
MLQQAWYHLGRFLVSVAARAGFELNIQWQTPLPEGPVILAANHPSTFDPALLTTLLKQRISIMIHGPIFTLPVFGPSLRYCGHIQVLRGRGGKSLDEAEALLKSGRSVAIFPEGAISPEGGFHRGRTGVARLALRSGVPVVPVGIYLDQKRLLRMDQTIDGVTDTAGYYFQGPYAMTVGTPRRFNGSVEDHSLVRGIATEIMEHIIQLSLESSRRSRAYTKQNWWFTTRWWAYSPIRLVRSWNAFASARM